MLANDYLHTMASKSHVSSNFIITFKEQSEAVDLINRSMIYLQNQEKELYSWVGESSYPKFMEKLRNIFKNAENDAKIMENFRKTNLNNLLNYSKIKKPDLEGQEVTIKCIVPDAIDITKLFEQLNTNTDNIIVKITNKQELSLNFEYNANNIKQVLNTIDNRSFDPSKSSKSSMKEVEKTITNLVDAGRIGSFIINKKTRNTEIVQKLGTNKNNPFAFTKGSIEAAIRYAIDYQDENLLDSLRQAANRIYYTLSFLCSGGSTNLKLAFETTWINKIGDNIENLSFFFKGNNIKSGVGGALQEFALAMMANYVANCIKQEGINNKKIATILGNIAFEHGEQPKTDVELLRTIGIQVKAYNQSSLVNYKGNPRRMTTNIHPSGLDDGLLGYGLNIGDAIVQACFNTSSGDIDELIQLVAEQALAQAMSFTTNDLSTIEQTVCFYFLDAKYLIPGSVILSRLQKVDKPSVSYRAPGAIGDDTYFKEDGFHTHYSKQLKSGRKEYEHTVDNSVEYWDKADQMTPTQENISYYDALYYKRISIDVKFKYDFMYGSNFAIY